jgi:acyl-CoA synthetase (AMP-forming)/AMP-acid ligase II
MGWTLTPAWSYASGGGSTPVAGQAIRAIERARAPGRLVLTGGDSVSLAAAALRALDLGWQVAFPAGAHDLRRWAEADFSLRVALGGRDELVETGGLAERAGSWDVAMCTSGTTGSPRTFGFSSGQLAGVCGLYRDYYRLDERAAIVTALPAAHNFAFVAGVCAAASAGSAMVFARTHTEVVSWLAARAGQGQAGRVIVLASPVLLETGGLESLPETDLLVDSGAAPVSRPYLARLRRAGIDIREGYGTTETLSLTHFDTDGTLESAGTVGYTVPGVDCRVGGDFAVWVRSPFTGTPLDSHFEPAAGPAPDWITTGDLGSHDAAGRLRLLGRAGDTRLGGAWPRDVLDALGEVLGPRTASVAIDERGVRIRLLTELTDQERAAVQGIAMTLTGSGREAVAVTDAVGQLTYSLKIPRADTQPSTAQPSTAQPSTAQPSTTQ